MREFRLLALLTLVNHVFSDNHFNKISYHQPQPNVRIAANPPPPPPARPPARPPPRDAAADDDLWDRSGAKGCTLGWAMQASDRDAGELYVPPRDTARSPFENANDLYRWFWEPYPKEKVDESFLDLYRTWGIGWALADLRLDPYTDEYGGKNNIWHIAHQSHDPKAPEVDKQSYIVNDKLYRATGASYSFTVNPEQGIIIALNRQSPRYAAKDCIPPVPADQLPELNQFSDVAWITWSNFARDAGVKNIKYFLSSMITNYETRRVLRRAHEANGWELSDWPGHTFERIWPETKAILGTPNVQGFAYFLIQHKKELGNMFIDKIQVFSGETAHERPCILMHVRQPLGSPGEVQESELAVQRENNRHVLDVHAVRARL